MGEGKCPFSTYSLLFCIRGAREENHCFMVLSYFNTLAPLLQWRWCWKSKDFIPFYLWCKCVVSSYWETCLGYVWPRQPDFSLPVLLFLHKVLQCCYRIIKMWRLCMWFCNKVSYLADACAGTVQARLKGESNLDSAGVQFPSLPPTGCGTFAFAWFLQCCFSLLWNRYHLFCSFTLLHFEFLRKKYIQLESKML